MRCSSQSRRFHMSCRHPSVLRFTLVALILAMGAGCASLPIPNLALFSLTVKAVDDKDAPVAGATVESSDGQRQTTGADGTAVLKFGLLGVHHISVISATRPPSSFTVTMPVDSGKTMQARLGAEIGGVMAGGDSGNG